MRAAAPLRPRQQFGESDTTVGTASDKTEARDVEDVLHFFLLEENAVDAFCDSLFLRKRRAFGQLNRDDEVPLILIRNEGRRRRAEQEQRRCERAGKERRDDPASAEEFRQQTTVPAPECGQSVIEPYEEGEVRF